MRQQRVDVAIESRWYTGEHVGEPGEWLVAVGLGSGEQTHDGGSAFARRFRSGEQPVLAPDSDWADGILDRVVVDRVSPVIGIADESGPTAQGVVDRVGRAAVAENGGAQCVQPCLDGVQRRYGMMLSIAEPFLDRHRFCFGFNAIQHGDAFDGFLSDLAAAGFVLVDKFAPCMRPTGELGHAFCEQGFVAFVVVNHQRTAVGAEKVLGMLSAAAGTEVEDDDRRPDAAAIRK